MGKLLQTNNLNVKAPPNKDNSMKKYKSSREVLENTLTKKTKHSGSLPNIGINLLAGKRPIKKFLHNVF